MERQRKGNPGEATLAALAVKREGSLSKSGCSEAFASSYRGIEKWSTHQVLTLEIVGLNPTPATKIF